MVAILGQKIVFLVTSFRLGLTQVQQPVWSEWHIQDGGQLSKTVPSLLAISHKSETSTATIQYALYI